MLTYDSLIEQAKNRQMPATKIRGILREYLQILILKEMYSNKTGQKLYFTGGTYLRLAHNIKRFSKDLDFNTKDITLAQFEKLTHKISSELEKMNIRSTVKHEHWGNLFVSNILFPEIEKEYGVISKYSKKEGITLKIETNVPKWKINTESKIIVGFGEVFPCICTEIGALFADKIDAFAKKTRARHLFDLIFLLSNKFKIDMNVLKSLQIKEPFALIIKRLESFSKGDIIKMADSIRPFLFEESDAELIVNARLVLPKLISDYKEHA